MKLQKCAVINDLSGFGRCSLAVALPILSAFGIQTCPVPTAILSNHTGYENYSFRDFTDCMPEYLENWAKLKLHFDAIYTGFLGSVRQVDIIIDFIEKNRDDNNTIFVDPVMGDNGVLYSTYNSEMCTEMRRLISLADVITPNLTEACILTGRPYIENPTDKQVYEIGEDIAGLGAGLVVITGIKREGEIVNFALDEMSGARFSISADYVQRKYSGTGDVFAATYLGLLMSGLPCDEALSRASQFLSRVTRFSFENDIPEEDGVAFEQFLMSRGTAYENFSEY